jgi:flagellar protein FliJ
MSALESLIRLHRWQIDERKRHLADLEALAAKLREEQRRLALEEEREQAVATASTEAAYAYAGYAHGLIERRRKLLQSLAEIDGQVAKAREALAEAFQEVKRYEITAASRLRQQQIREQKRQQRTLDELGVEAYRRRTNSR